MSIKIPCYLIPAVSSRLSYLNEYREMNNPEKYLDYKNLKGKRQ